MSIFPHLAVLGLAASLSSPIHQHQIDFKATSPDGIQRINQLWLVTYINEAGLETVAQAKLVTGAICWPFFVSEGFPAIAS